MNDPQQGELFARVKVPHMLARLLQVPAEEKADSYHKVKALKKGGDDTGGQMVDTPVTISFDDQVNPAGVEQKACTLCGDCCSGCNVFLLHHLAKQPQVRLEKSTKHRDEALYYPFLDFPLFLYNDRI